MNRNVGDERKEKNEVLDADFNRSRYVLEKREGKKESFQELIKKIEKNQITEENKIKQTMIDLGWNPYIEYTQDSKYTMSDRTKKVLQDNILNNYIFSKLGKRLLKITQQTFGARQKMMH